MPPQTRPAPAARNQARQTPANLSERQKYFAARLPDGLARFAAGLRMKGQPAR